MTKTNNKGQSKALPYSMMLKAFFQIKAYILFEVRHLDSTSYHN